MEWGATCLRGEQPVVLRRCPTLKMIASGALRTSTGVRGGLNKADYEGANVEAEPRAAARRRESTLAIG